MLKKLMRYVPEGGKHYCEPYMGAATLFFARKPAPVEVLNDLNGDLVNLFRCLQDKSSFEELKHRIHYTLYSRAEFCKAVDILKESPSHYDPITRAWAFFVSFNMGFSGQAKSYGSWSRTFTTVNGCAATTNRWIMRLSSLEDWHLRLLSVQIDNRDAIDVIRYWDAPDAVFYLDPPYHLETRASKVIYQCEIDHNHHEILVQTILKSEGAVVLSGYEHPVHQPLIDAGWTVVRYKTSCFAAGRTRQSGIRGKGSATAKLPRTEVIFVNPKALAMLGKISPLEIG